LVVAQEGACGYNPPVPRPGAFLVSLAALLAGGPAPVAAQDARAGADAKVEAAPPAGGRLVE
jgi:hypothetical protein